MFWWNKKQTEKSHEARQLSTRNGREKEKIQGQNMKRLCLTRLPHADQEIFQNHPPN